MSDVTLTSHYEFNMGAAVIEMGFTADSQLFTKMMFVKKIAPFDTISSVTVKKGALTSKIQYDIKTRKDNGKEQIFQIIQIDSADDNGIRFVNELKSKIPATCVWTDKLEANAVNVKDQSSIGTYPLQVMWMVGSKSLAGQGRGLQLFMNYGMITIVGLLIPLPLLIYVYAAGCHRVTTDSNGITIKKLAAKYYNWDDVERIDVQKLNMIITNNGSLADNLYLLIFTLVAKDGSKKEFKIRSLEGKQFVKEMIDRKKIAPELAAGFI